jgi:hypothetical protein
MDLNVINELWLLTVFFWVIPRHMNSDAGELPRRKRTTYRTRRKFEIENTIWLSRILRIDLRCVTSFFIPHVRDVCFVTSWQICKSYFFLLEGGGGFPPCSSIGFLIPLIVQGEIVRKNVWRCSCTSVLERERERISFQDSRRPFLRISFVSNRLTTYAVNLCQKNGPWAAWQLADI